MTYSGRLAYHQACGSIIITPPLNFIQHTATLLQPIYASSLLESSSNGPYLQRHPTGSTPAFPVSHDLDKGNVVFVAKDWSNLEATIEWLEANPVLASRIAKNQKHVMVGQGFLSTQAEVCYWRALIHMWAQKTKPKEAGERAWGQWEEEGVRFETYAVTGKLAWE